MPDVINNSNLYHNYQEGGLTEYELQSVLSLIALKANNTQLSMIIDVCNNLKSTPRADYTISNSGKLVNY